MAERPVPAHRLTVVGIGADGVDGLPAASRMLIANADVLLGSPRQLALVPPIPGQSRLAWHSPLRGGLPAFLDALPRGAVVALASGDPLLSGIAATLIDLLGADAVRVIPAVSSVALARAELGWSSTETAVVSLVGRPVTLIARELAPGRRILALSTDATTPAAVARLLVTSGYGASRLHVLGDLGSASASRVDGVAETWAGSSPDLNVIGIEVVGPPGYGWVAGLPDEAFEAPVLGRDARASALARLAPTPGEQLWDIGAGSVGIEWCRAHPTCRATAIEADPERAAGIARSAADLGVPTLKVIAGRAPGALADLPTPDAIFVAGGAATPELVEVCLAALAPGGRLVVQAASSAAAELLASLHAGHGGELMRLFVEPLPASGAAEARGITQWFFTRPHTARRLRLVDSE